MIINSPSPEEIVAEAREALNRRPPKSSSERFTELVRKGWINGRGQVTKLLGGIAEPEPNYQMWTLEGDVFGRENGTVGDALRGCRGGRSTNAGLIRHKKANFTMWVARLLTRRFDPTPKAILAMLILAICSVSLLWLFGVDSGAIKILLGSLLFTLTTYVCYLLDPVGGMVSAERGYKVGGLSVLIWIPWVVVCSWIEAGGVPYPSSNSVWLVILAETRLSTFGGAACRRRCLSFLRSFPHGLPEILLG